MPEGLGIVIFVTTDPKHTQSCFKQQACKLKDMMGFPKKPQSNLSIMGKAPKAW